MATHEEDVDPIIHKPTVVRRSRFEANDNESPKPEEKRVRMAEEIDVRFVEVGEPNHVPHRQPAGTRQQYDRATLLQLRESMQSNRVSVELAPTMALVAAGGRHLRSFVAAKPFAREGFDTARRHVVVSEVERRVLADVRSTAARTQMPAPRSSSAAPATALRSSSSLRPSTQSEVNRGGRQPRARSSINRTTMSPTRPSLEDSTFIVSDGSTSNEFAVRLPGQFNLPEEARKLLYSTRFGRPHRVTRFEMEAPTVAKIKPFHLASPKNPIVEKAVEDKKVTDPSPEEKVEEKVDEKTPVRQSRAHSVSVATGPRGFSMGPPSTKDKPTSAWGQPKAPPTAVGDTIEAALQRLNEKPCAPKPSWEPVWGEVETLKPLVEGTSLEESLAIISRRNPPPPGPSYAFKNAKVTEDRMAFGVAKPVEAGSLIAPPVAALPVRNKVKVVSNRPRPHGQRALHFSYSIGELRRQALDPTAVDEGASFLLTEFARAFPQSALGFNLSPQGKPLVGHELTEALAAASSSRAPPSEMSKEVKVDGRVRQIEMVKASVQWQILEEALAGAPPPFHLQPPQATRTAAVVLPDDRWAPLFNSWRDKVAEITQENVSVRIADKTMTISGRRVPVQWAAKNLGSLAPPTKKATLNPGAASFVPTGETPS